VLRHALQPLLSGFSDWVTTFVVQDDRQAESIARSLLELWLTSVLNRDIESLTAAYSRMTLVISRHEGSHLAGIVVDLLSRDAPRLPPTLVLSWLLDILGPGGSDAAMEVGVLECLVAIGAPALPGTQELANTLADKLPASPLYSGPATLRLRTFLVLSELGQPAAARRLFGSAEEFLDQVDIRAALATDRTLRLRLENLP
jgi:hypothetical protein